LTSFAYLITNLPKISILITIFDISSQVLDQCTYRLELNSAARGIYTEDGTMIMEIEDLIDWAVENYKTLMAEYLQGKDAKGRSCDNIEYLCYLLCRQIVHVFIYVV
jgi:hypothetical protein